MSVIFSLETKIIIAAILRKGPKGMIFSLLEKRIIKATGKAMNVARKIVIIAIGKSRTRPKRNINLMSPPPRDSFLKALSPRILIAYITKKAPIPE